MSSHRSCGSPASAFNKRSLRLLVCSGNLGNAAPDLQSLASWIPIDGDCSAVLVDSPRYPIPSQEHAVTSSPSDQNHADGQDVIVEEDGDESLDDEGKRKFELIVVGMQESTFDVSVVAPADDEDAQDEPNDGSVTLPSSLGELPSALVELPTTLGKNVAKAGFTTAHTAKRGITAVKTLATSKDYVKNRAKQNSQDVCLINIASRATNALTEFTADGTNVLHAMLQQHLPSYQHIVSFQRGEMRLEIFALKDDEENGQTDGQDYSEKSQGATHNPSWVQVLSVKAQNTGRGGLANKGGILAQLLVGNTTRLSFMTAHLEAHEGKDKYKMRVTTLADILSGTQTDTRFDASLTSHSLFALGDLNFRTELNLSGGEEYDKEKQMETVLEWVKNQNWEKLNEFDELQHALRRKDCLVGFQTLPCLFPPTFKVERKAGYSYKGNRRPSYTDRILWKTIPSHFGSSSGEAGSPGFVRPLIYEPIDEFSTSDHKPVRGAFEVQINERLRLRPAMHKWQSKRSRRRSLLKSTKERSSSGCVHVFIRDMKCQISSANYTKVGSSGVPDPYLCFMSRPKELIRMEQRKWKDKWKTLFNCAQASEEANPNKNGAVVRSTLGWPRSKKMWGTFDPDWEDDEVHFTLQTHDQEGLPIELAGALMFVTLMDHGAALEDYLIGSAVFNLQEMFTATHPLCQKSRLGAFDNNNTDQRDSQTPNNSGGSNRHIANRSLFSAHPRASIASEISGICSYRIDEPLCKNGKEMGRIQCLVDAWWLDDFTARSAAARRASHASLPAEIYDHPPVGSLASRRRVNRPQTDVSNGSRAAKRGIRFWRTWD